MDKKLDHSFNNLKCAAKVNLPLGFNLKNLEDERFRFFYAHENKTLLDRSKLVCSKDDLAKLKDVLNEIDVIDFCSRKKRKNKTEVPQVNKLDSICRFTQRCTYGLQGRCFTQTYAWKSHNQKFHFQREHKTTI